MYGKESQKKKKNHSFMVNAVFLVSHQVKSGSRHLKIYQLREEK